MREGNFTFRPSFKRYQSANLRLRQEIIIKVVTNVTHVTRKIEGVTKRGKRRKRRSQSSRMF